MRLGAFACWFAMMVAPALAIETEVTRNDPAVADFFERKIRPLFIKHCCECHSADKAVESGHLALDGREGLISGGTRGPLFVPESPDESLLITAVRYSEPKLQMPPDGKLPPEEIQLLEQWVKMGGFIPEYGIKNRKKDKTIDWDSARQFWSFLPFQPDIPPVVPPGLNVLQPIDAFICQSLSKHDLCQSRSADRRSLIRRLSFDLLGLPPRSDEVCEFLEDERIDSYERLTDRLLASPHFGEQWARYWLDLARYTDVTPSWLKNADQAWLYRDWVIRATNEDLPYDHFVKRQLAADLIEGTEPTDYAALGFIGLSPTYWKELRLAPNVIEIIVADEWDERIDAVSRTFLGLTVACARCHDHKFDPITSRDYYALAGIFASTQLTDRPLLASPLAEKIVAARQRVDKLEEAFKAFKNKESDEAKNVAAEIEKIKSTTPQFDARMAHTVEDASLFVLPDGPDMTKLDVRKNQPRDLPIFRRGNPGNPGEIVPRRFIEVLSPSTPQPFLSGSGRREFADALFHDANALTARVMANRIWSHHFGRGIVRSPSDFGAQGDRPSHPELLEWLAKELGDNTGPESSSNWTLKRIHRQLVTSATYRQTSNTHSDQSRLLARTDPENVWLARMSRRRLDVEPWRDTMLAAAGTLDATMTGPAIELDQPNNRRRTVYGKVGRDEQNDFLRLYDFPPPTSHSPARDITTTPLQQLFVLNSEFFDYLSAAFFSRIQTERRNATTREKIEFCYQQLFQRSATDLEIQFGERFLSTKTDNDAIDTKRWTLYIHSLFGLNELLFVD